MKIILLSPLPPPSGGIAFWTQKYLESKQARANQVFLINTAVVGSRIKRITRRNVFQEAKRAHKIMKQLQSQLTNSGADIVHINVSGGQFGLVRDYFLAKKSKQCGSKVVVHCHFHVPFMISNKFARYNYRKLTGIADKIITLNKESHDFTLETFGRKSVILPNFIPLQMVDDLEKRKQFRDELVNCLYVGNVTREKGCDLIIDVAKILPDMKFTLAGWVSEEIIREAKTSNVIFTGEIEHEKVIEYMLRADIFVFPSHAEGFPTVILEAMACGLPIVATPVGSIPDVIGEKGGKIFRVGDLNGFASAIIGTATDISAYKAMSEWNHDRVRKRYSENIVMDNLFKEYANMVDCHIGK